MEQREKIIETEEVSLPEQCNTFYCFKYDPIIKVYFSENNSYVNSIGSEFKSIVCFLPQYKCVDINIFYATYNCIGWALGVSQWLNPLEITNNIQSHGMTIKQAIDNFLLKISNDFPLNHISNFGNIVDKLSTKTVKTYPVANNTVGFYFKNDECLHGSRYLETINGQLLNQWTSKLGQEILISHEETTLLDSTSVYGDTIHFAGIGKAIVHDEL